MSAKICFICKEKKLLTDFYKHKQLIDGHLNKCKECCKKQSKEREEILRKNPEFVEKEKERAREKYSRLGYKEKQKQWDANKPWKNTSAYKNQSRDFSIPDGFDIHHWNYNLLKNFFILKKSQHKKAHKFLIFDDENLIFKGLDSEILDTKEKHMEYLKSKGIKF